MTQRTSRRTVLTATTGLAGAAAVAGAPPLPRGSRQDRGAPASRSPTRRANGGPGNPAIYPGPRRHRRRPRVRQLF